MKIEEAIEWMEEAVQETTECFEQCSPSLQKELVMQKEVFELAISALRSMLEAGEPLSLEQLREVPHGKIKDSTLQNIANRANEIASPPAHIDRREWISVKERLPDDEKDGETVLAIVSGKPHKNIMLCHALMTAGYFYQGGWLVDEYPEWENPTITHWIPLPEPPEEG